MSPDSVRTRPIGYVWDRVGDWVADVGRITLLVLETFRNMLRGLRSTRLVIDQMHIIGVQSLVLVLIVSLFVGAVAAVQAAYQFASVVPLKYIGSVILRSVIIELGPVLTSLIVGGRVGAAIAAELGTMRVTEQIDALEAMAINPVRYLVVPRVVASIIMLPILVMIANAVAIFGGYVVSVTSVGVSTHTYVQGLQDFFYMKDLMSGLIKTLFFGAIIGWMGCYHGFRTEGGAEGVGRSTTQAVVLASMAILIANFLLTKMMF